jgi:hypothetical protein
MQLELDCIEWVLGKIQVNKIPNDRLEGAIRTIIKDLEKRKDKAMIRPETEDFCTKIEALQGSSTLLILPSINGSHSSSSSSDSSSSVGAVVVVVVVVSADDTRLRFTSIQFTFPKNVSYTSLSISESGKASTAAAPLS